MNARRMTLTLGILSVLMLAAGLAWSMPMPGPYVPVAGPADPGRSAPPPTGMGRRTAPPPTGGFNLPPPQNPSAPAPGQGTPQPVGPVSTDYADMIREANLSLAQQKTVNNFGQKEQQALAKFDQDNAKKLDDLRKKLADAKNDIARNANQRQIDNIAATRERTSHSYKMQAMGVFNAQQKAAWATYVLNKIIGGEFAVVALTAEQQATIKILCEQAGKTVTNADVSANNELQDTLKQQVVAQVLDDPQRLLYAQVLQQRQAAKTAAMAGGTPTP